MKQLKLFGRDLPVPLPPHGFFSERIADRVLVLGAAAGVLAGGDHQRTIGGQDTLAIPHRMFDQRGSTKVGENFGAGGNALTIERVAEHGGSQSRLHEWRGAAVCGPDADGRIGMRARWRT